MFILCSLVCNVINGQTIKDSVKIHFRQSYSNLDFSIRENRESLSRIADRLENYSGDSVYILKRIDVIGGASPEGSIPLNIRLSEKRANTLFNYLARYGSLPDSLKNVIHLGRDWGGLLSRVVLDENVPYHDDVVIFLQEIVDKSKSGEIEGDNNVGKLKRFKGGSPYRYMYNNIFPDLRASTLILSYNKTFNPLKIKSLDDDFSYPLHSEFESVSLSFPTPIITPITPKPFYMALKTNMLYDAAIVPNIGVEFYLGSNLSIVANWMYAWWKNDHSNWYWRIYGGDLALRMWFGKEAKKKPLSGHHAGVYFQTLTYDFEVGGRGYIGGVPGGDIFDRANFAAGVEYGYSLPIARRLNIDFTLGVGYLWGKYYEYIPIDNCYVWQSTNKRKFFGPTKAEISLVWLIGKGNYNKEKGGKKSKL